MEEELSPCLLIEGQMQYYDTKMKEICLGSKFFTTVNGVTGMGPREDKKGNLVVCLPFGVSPFPIPFVLQDPSHSSFILVGSCCVNSTHPWRA